MESTEGINAILVRFVALENVINHQLNQGVSMLVMQNDNVHTEREKQMDEDIKLISSILKCEDKPLLNKIAGAIAVFDSLDLLKEYTINFSGGKDSHALLIVFLLWRQIRELTNTDNFTVIFADTMLEVEHLYKLIENVENFLSDIKITRKKPEHSYWYHQFIFGYPVPNHFNRWCTGKLKVDVISSGDCIPITGRHKGESQARDRRLACSSGECGTDKIKKSHDPIIDFRNCDVWDLLFYADGTIIYEGLFNLLKSTYSQSESESGSLRMGCIMCPVIAMSTLYADPSRKPFMEIRTLLEELRNCRRILNPRIKKPGAIYIGDRRMMWQKLNKELLLSLGYITQSEIELISECLESDYSYPKTYTREWIDSEHERLAKQTIYTGLPLFECSGK